MVSFPLLLPTTPHVLFHICANLDVLYYFWCLFASPCSGLWYGPSRNEVSVHSFFLASRLSVLAILTIAFSWIRDTYSQLNPGHMFTAGCVTGKPVGHGGIRGRESSTGLGVFYAIRSILSHQGVLKKVGLRSPGVSGKTFVIQGFGNVGYWSSKFIEEDGGKIIAIAEHDGILYDRERGISVQALKEHMTLNNGSSLEFTNNGSSSFRFVREPAAFVGIECDVLVPAALESVIHDENAHLVKAKIIAEAANGPITADADMILNNRDDIVIIPDLLTNSMGVCISSLIHFTF